MLVTQFAPGFTSLRRSRTCQPFRDLFWDFSYIYKPSSLFVLTARGPLPKMAPTTSRSMETLMTYLRNTWYVAAWADEVGNTGMFHRTLLDEPILFYRKSDGTIVALQDRCPHRFIPL